MSNSSNAFVLIVKFLDEIVNLVENSRFTKMEFESVFRHLSLALDNTCRDDIDLKKLLNDVESSFSKTFTTIVEIQELDKKHFYKQLLEFQDNSNRAIRISMQNQNQKLHSELSKMKTNLENEKAQNDRVLKQQITNLETNITELNHVIEGLKLESIHYKKKYEEEVKNHLRDNDCATQDFNVKFDAERTKLIQEYEAEKVSYKENLLYRYSSNLTKLKEHFESINANDRTIQQELIDENKSLTTKIVSLSADIDRFKQKLQLQTEIHEQKMADVVSSSLDNQNLMQNYVAQKVDQVKMEESKKYKHLLEKLEHEKMNQLKNHQLEINELCRQFEEEKTRLAILFQEGSISCQQCQQEDTKAVKQRLKYLKENSTIYSDVLNADIESNESHKFSTINRVFIGDHPSVFEYRKYSLNNSLEGNSFDRETNVSIKPSEDGDKSENGNDDGPVPRGFLPTTSS